MRARLFLAFLVAFAPLLAAGEAGAQPSGVQPLDRLLPQIRRNVPGQFLDAEGAGTGSNPHYHLKWLTPDGRVVWLDADARTGRVLGQSPGRDTFDGQRFRGEAQGGPPDRRDEGPSTMPPDERSGPPRFDNRRQYRQQPYVNGGGNEGEDRGGYGRPDRNGGGRFGGRDFGNGGYGNRSGGDPGNRGSGGGRDRHDDGR